MLKKIIRYLGKIFIPSSPRKRPASKKKSSVRKSSARHQKRNDVRRTTGHAKKIKPSKKVVKVEGKKVLKAEIKLKPKEIKFKEVYVGDITHYFGKIQVVVLSIKGQGIASGDQLHVKGPDTDFIQKVSSMQIESVDVKSAKKGQLVGLKVEKIAKVGDKAFKLEK